MTDTKEAEKIAKELSEKVGNNLTVELVGFGESGIDVGEVAGGFKTASALGGNSGMKKLNKALKDLGIASYMDFDLISFNKSGNGFNKNSSAIYDGGELVTYTSFDALSHVRNDDRFYVLSRENLFNATDKLINKAQKMDLSGIALSSLSNTIYSDYADQNYYACGKIAEDVAKIFKNVKKSGYKLLSASANVYAAVSSDEITDTPIYSSGYSFTSYDVPFYQMVFKGYIPMSSVSLNLCTDREDALLRCVSAGITPSYTLINNYNNELITSAHSFIYASVYSSNKENIISEVNGISDYLESVENAEITEYRVIGEDVALTKFSNNVWTVVNFSDSEISCEYGNVPAKSFISGRDE